MDERRAGTRSESGRKWAPTGHRPYCRVQIGYQSLYLYLAVCPFRGKGYAALLPTMAGSGFGWFIQPLNRSIKAPTLLVADGSRTHTAGGFTATQLTFSKLPAYCPELNPVEGIFKELRYGLKSRVFSTIAAAERQLTRVLIDA
ncbi:transposase [Spirosoma luteolum]